ncbi:Endonuclease/exonuclease/phosphatase, partial [Mycena pura]
MQANANGTPSTPEGPDSNERTHTPASHARRAAIPGCPRDDEHAPAFFEKKRRKQQTGNPKITRNTRASFTLAAFNINGTKASSLKSRKHKWHQLHRLIFEEQIGVAIVSETHLSAAQTQEIEESHMKKRLRIYNSQYPENPAAKGIAIVVNRELMNIDGIKVHYLIPGKAMLAVIPYHGKSTHTVLALYGPTESAAAKVAFYDRLCELYLTTDLPVPDSVSGDFNLVEDARDRLPHHPDDGEVVAAFARFKRLLNLKDGWRAINPDELAFTYTSTCENPTLSRIDRIYMPEDAMKCARDWEISDALGKLTDHKMVTVRITTPGSPFIGPGRYTLPLFLIHDKDFTTFAVDRFATLEGDMSQPRTEERNPQTLLQDALNETIIRGRDLAKTKVGASTQKRRKNLAKIRAALNPPRASGSSRGTAPPRSSPPAQLSEAHTSNCASDAPLERQAEVAAEVAALYKENDEIMYSQVESRRLETRVRAHTDHDTITSHTMRLGKDKKPRDTITYLKRTDVSPEIGSKKSCEMAELARDYHNALQSDGLDVDISERQAAEEEVL